MTADSVLKILFQKTKYEIISLTYSNRSIIDIIRIIQNQRPIQEIDYIHFKIFRGNECEDSQETAKKTYYLEF